MSASQEERKTANSSEESEQFTDDDDLPELVTDSDSDLENNKLPELGAGNEDNKPKPAPRRAPPPARRHRELKPRELKLPDPPARRHRELQPRELKLPELPTGKPPPRRRFTKGTVPLPEVRKSQLRPVSPVDPSAPAAVDTF
jgi:hypothetical protein